MIKTTKRKQFSYPSSDNYSQEVHTDEGVGRLVVDCFLERLLTELEGEGIDVSAPRAELTAIKNFVTHSRKFKSDVRNHVLFLLNRCE